MSTRSTGKECLYGFNIIATKLSVQSNICIMFSNFNDYIFPFFVNFWLYQRHLVGIQVCCYLFHLKNPDVEQFLVQWRLEAWPLLPARQTTCEIIPWHLQTAEAMEGGVCYVIRIELDLKVRK